MCKDKSLNNLIFINGYINGILLNQIDRNNSIEIRI